MTVFETTAVLEDASHLTLREPAPATSGRECRVILLLDGEPDTRPVGAWPADFFGGIRVTDPAFTRPVDITWPEVQCRH